MIPEAGSKISEVCPKNGNSIILIGPEGDFSSEEIEMALSKEFHPCSSRTEPAENRNGRHCCLPFRLLYQSVISSAPEINNFSRFLSSEPYTIPKNGTTYR